MTGSLQIDPKSLQILRDIYSGRGVVEYPSDVSETFNQIGQKIIELELNTSALWLFTAYAAVFLAWLLCRYVSFNGWEKFVIWCVAVIAAVVTVIQFNNVIACKTFPEKVIYEYLQYYETYNEGCVESKDPSAPREYKE